MLLYPVDKPFSSPDGLFNVNGLTGGSSCKFLLENIFFLVALVVDSVEYFAVIG